MEIMEVVKLFTEAAEAQAKRDTAITEAEATRNDQIAKITAEYETTSANLKAQIIAHPRYEEIAVNLGELFGVEKPKAEKKAAKAKGEKKVVFVLTQGGTDVTFSDGTKVTYEREVNFIAPSLKSVLGEDLSEVALKRVSDDTILATKLGWKNVRQAAA